MKLKIQSSFQSLLSSVKLLFKPKVIKAFMVKPIYEIHVTVDINKSMFLKKHKSWKYKAICIDLLNGETHTMFNLITKNKNDLQTLESYIEHVLKLPILRSKIEANLPSNNDCYGEVHFEIDSEFLHLYNQEVLYPYYPSQNILKPSTIMLTGRFYNKEQLLTIKDDFKSLQAISYIDPTSKLIVEYCIYDNNQKLDNTWIK